VKELDALRFAVEMKWLFGRYNPPNSGCSRQYSGSEKSKAVEEMVRTHMLAGHIAEDLYASERQPQAAKPECTCRKPESGDNYGMAYTANPLCPVHGGVMRNTEAEGDQP
jgi:hypothetical protein